MAVATLIVLVFKLGPALPTADRASLWIDTVQQGQMLREVRATGTLVPRSSRWLAAATAAQVDTILVWPGATVAPDTVLMTLANPEVEDALRNAQAQVAAARADVEARRAELQSALLDERSALAQAQSDYASAKVKADADAKAATLHLIPEVQFRQGQIALEQLGELPIERFADDQIENRVAQKLHALVAVQSCFGNGGVRQRLFEEIRTLE
jgi:multidrug efflux pump subunit AcrA (membrane-fusion protein)